MENNVLLGAMPSIDQGLIESPEGDSAVRSPVQTRRTPIDELPRSWHGSYVTPPPPPRRTPIDELPRSWHGSYVTPPPRPTTSPRGGGVVDIQPTPDSPKPSPTNSFLTDDKDDDDTKGKSNIILYAIGGIVLAYLFLRKK